MNTIWKGLQRLYHPTDPLRKVALVVAIPAAISLVGRIAFNSDIIWIVGTILQISLLILVIMSGKKYLNKKEE